MKYKVHDYVQLTDAFVDRFECVGCIAQIDNIDKSLYVITMPCGYGANKTLFITDSCIERCIASYEETKNE